MESFEEWLAWYVGLTDEEFNQAIEEGKKWLDECCKID